MEIKLTLKTGKQIELTQEELLELREFLNIAQVYIPPTVPNYPISNPNYPIVTMYSAPYGNNPISYKEEK